MRGESALWGFLLNYALIFDACYKPDFNSVIYKCDVYLCPMGQVCNSDQICVNYPVAGCTNGGIATGNDIFLCPGANNLCAPGYAVCAAPPLELACHPPTAEDLGAATPCLPCCLS